MINNLLSGLRWNYEFLLFTGPWAPFDKWHLKEDYRKSSKRKELTNYLKSKIALVALLNFLLMPLILFWQILYSFFNYAELIKREPGHLGKGASMKDVPSKSGLFDPLPPLSPL